jgi:hypothetical protein
MSKMNDFNPLLKETFVFRPFNGDEGVGVLATPSFQPSGYKHEGQGLLRYADGKWIPDDGEPDLAFVHGVVAFGVRLPSYTNIIWEWLDLELTRSLIPEYLRREVNGWHYMTTNNKAIHDHYWFDKEKHPNEIAHKSAMDKCCEIHSVANGRGPELWLDNEWIKRGLLYVKSTMTKIVAPDNPVCCLCQDNGRGHLLIALQSKKSNLEAEIEFSQEKLSKAESDTYHYQDVIESSQEELVEINDEIKQMEESNVTFS